MCFLQFTASLETTRPPGDFYTPAWTRNGYEFDPLLASEEDATSWISFLESRISVPGEQYLVPEINAYVNRKVDVVLTVPRNAEPGYHAVHILPSPEVSAEATQGVGVGIITLVKAGAVFRVPGDVIRAAEIMGFDYDRVSPDYEEIRVLVKNTGTVTMSLSLEGVEIDEGGKTVKLASSSQKRVKPNGIEMFTVRYPAAGKELGSYSATASVSWEGGNAEKGGVVEITEYTGKPSITGQAIAPPGAEFPLWIAPILIMFSAILFYWWHNGKG